MKSCRAKIVDALCDMGVLDAGDRLDFEDHRLLDNEIRHIVSNHVIAVLYAERLQLLDQAGLPKGVMNIIHGGRECVDALLTHPKVKAISFVGSTPIARHVFEVGTKHGKRVQSNGGAKNYVFIMPDADVENSSRGVIEAAFGCAGERWHGCR